MLLMARSPAAQTPVTPGAWLKAAREARGLKQYQVAEVLHVVPTTISSYEHGRIKKIDEDYIPALARILRKTVQETRRGLGMYVDEGAADEELTPVSVVEAILADPELLPEAKEHLTRQYGLLLRLTDGGAKVRAVPDMPSQWVDTAHHDAERLAEIEQQVERSAILRPGEPEGIVRRRT